MYFDNFDALIGCDYQIIAPDPPWNYKDKASAGNRGAIYKYPCMTVQELCELPVGEIAARDSILAMWTTGPMLVDGTAERVARAWGFIPKTTLFTWVKTTKTGKEWHWGMGRWTRANPEFVVLYTRGKPTRVSAAVHSVIKAPVQEHSRKPAEYRERLVQLMGNVLRIELFARGESDNGFDAWGNEPPYELREAA